MAMTLIILEICLLSLFGKSAIAAAIDSNAEHTQKVENSPPTNHIDTTDDWLSPSPSDSLASSIDYNYPSFVRYARNPDGFIRFGRSGSSFVRFGRSRKFSVPQYDRTGRDDNFVRFGRSGAQKLNVRPSSQNFLRFGRYNDNNRIRFSGKRDGSGGVLRKLPENFDFLFNDIAQSRSLTTNPRDHVDDDIAFDELLASDAVDQ